MDNRDTEHLLTVYCWMQVGREIQGITSVKGDNSEEHWGEEGASEKLAARS